MRVNAVFQGGGVKGIGLVGAVETAEKRGITFYRTAGTSVGAIVAAFLAAGYNGEEMKQMILETPFTDFTDKDFFHHFTVVGPAIRFFLKKGLYSGDTLEEWIAQHLKRKGIVTFGDLPEHALRVVASDITQGKMLVLPEDIRQYGVDPEELPVAKAVRMSASLPFFFDPVVYRKRGKQNRIKNIIGNPYYIVDGGILSNYPLWIFDRDINDVSGSNLKHPQIPTLGFQLVGKSTAAPRRIYGPISMLQALFSTMMSAHDERYIEKHSRFRTIKIPSDMVQTTDFDISKEKMMELYTSGVKAAEKFFEEWSYTGYASELDKWIHTMHS